MIYLITGLRSGTSMMMEACEAGGMDVVKSNKRDKTVHVAVMRIDDNYKANPVSFYEPEYKNEVKHPGWPRQYDGKVLKVIIPFLKYISVHGYRVLHMRRDAEEIRQSYFAAHGGRYRDIQSLITEAIASLRNRKDVIDYQELWYPDVLEDPLGTIASLNWSLDVQKAALVVDQTLYRFRREKLVVGR